MSAHIASAESGPMSRIISSSDTAPTGFTSASALAENCVATTTSVGMGMTMPRLLRLLEQALADVQHGRLVQRLADIEAQRREKGIGDAAAHDHLIDLAQQGFQHRELGGYLRAGDDGEQRPRRLLERRLQRRQFADQQRAGAGHRRVLRDSVSARLGAMRRAERIHHIDIAQRGHFLRQIVRVLLFALVEAHVLEQHDLAGVNVHAVQPVLLQGHRHPQQLRQALGHGSEREFLRVLALLGTAEMRHHQHARPRRQRRLDGRQRRANPRIAAHHPILNRHVQVLADQHPLAAQIQTRHSFDDHLHSMPARSASSGGLRPSDGGIEHAVRKAPLIVVPRTHLHQVPLDDLGLSGIVGR